MSAYDNFPAMPGTKVDAHPETTPSNQTVDAAEFNALSTGIADLRLALQGGTPSEGGAGNYFQYAKNTSPPSSAVNAVQVFTDGVSLLGQFNGGHQQSLYDGHFNVMAYGAKGDGTTDDTTAIQAAITAAGVGGGTVWFPPGTYKITSGLVSTANNVHFAGAGRASLISASGVSSGAAITISGSRCSARDIGLSGVHNITGWRVSGLLSGSCECVNLLNLFTDGVTGTSGIAYGVGDDTGTDTSEITLVACTSDGDSTNTTHLQIGNGGTGNVLDVMNVGGNAQVHKYGVIVNGGSLVSHGLNFQGSAAADIWLKQEGEGPTQIRGGRSENSLRVVVCAFGHVGYCAAEVADLVAINVKNTDGQGIQLSTPYSLRITNVFMTGLNCPQYISLPQYVDPSVGGIPPALEVDGFMNDAPYAFGSPWSKRGDNIRARNLRFAYDGIDTGTQYGNGNFQRVHRMHVTTASFIAGHMLNASSALTVYPDVYDVLQIGLGESYTGTVTIAPGSFLGQKITLVYVQDGAGGWSYSLPSNVVWNAGSSPSAVTTARNRQKMTFEWTGQCWEATGSVTNTVIASQPSNSVTEDFTNPSPSPFYLIQPYSSGSPSGSNNYETVPGGGSLGIVSGVCVTNNVANFGDSGVYSTGNGLLGTDAAGVVVETGSFSQTHGVSATFKWEANEGVIVHYLDDSTFMAVYITSGTVFVRGFSDGKVVYNTSFAGPSLTVGTSHTLLVKCTATQLIISVDGGSTTTLTPNALWNDLSKHGFFSTSKSAQFTAFSVT